MLVLSRHKNEQIRIGDDIIITVIEMRSGSKVRIGIEAPKEVSVHREEVYQLIKRKQENSNEGQAQ